MTEPADDAIAERWVFGGSRIGKNNKRLHEWIGPEGESLTFKAAGSFVVGSIYEAKVGRPANGRVTLYGRPAYTGERCEDAQLIDRLAAQHRAAESALSLKARERADKKDDPVEQAIDRLVDLARHVPPSQRTAFTAHVLNRLTRAW